MDKIFLLFQKLSDSKTQGGTGLGLSLCKKIVQDHNGFIFAEGEENHGATFTIFLPKEQHAENIMQGNGIKSELNK